MFLVQKKIQTSNGLFKIGAVAENDFMIRFIANGKGSTSGKKHFHTVDEAEAYINLLVVSGFTKADF